MTIADRLPLARRILLGLIAVEIALLALMFSGAPGKVPAYLGFVPERSGTPLAWVLASITVIAYVWSAASISLVRHYLFKPDRLKLLAVVAAILAGVLEEVIFRKVLMDYLSQQGLASIVQVAASAAAFGLAHAVWAFRSIAAGINAVLSTSLLGGALAIVYLAGERSLAPCVVAHIVITALIEPGLLLAAVSDRLGVWKEKDPA